MARPTALIQSSFSCVPSKHSAEHQSMISKSMSIETIMHAQDACLLALLRSSSPPRQRAADAH